LSPILVVTDIFVKKNSKTAYWSLSARRPVCGWTIQLHDEFEFSIQSGNCNSERAERFSDR